MENFVYDVVKPNNDCGLVLEDAGIMHSYMTKTTGKTVVSSTGQA